MTAPRRDGHEEPFNAWLRSHPMLDSSPGGAALSIQNVDFLVHKYIVTDKCTRRQLTRQHMMLVELKTNGASVNFAQRDTFNVLDQVLQSAHLSYAEAKRGLVKVFYHGFHVLRLSGSSPIDSKWMTWDEKPISTDRLISVLRFDFDARTLRLREDRLHHKQHPLLWEDVLRPQR